MSLARRAVLALPYLWLSIFFIAPMALVAKISLSHPALARPPYEPVFSLSEGFTGALEKLRALNLDAYRGLVEDSLYLESFLTSLIVAAISTLITLLIAFPFALALARAPRRLRPILIGLAVAPFWTSFLIRVYAWIALLKDEGLINHALMTLGLIREPLGVYATNVAVVIGIVYSYLPFMLLPLYSALERQDPSLREAAADLGRDAGRSFPARHPAPVAARHHRGLPARVHSGRRRVRDPGPPRRFGFADDRPHDLERVLRQPGLAGGERCRDRAAAASARPPAAGRAAAAQGREAEP